MKAKKQTPQTILEKVNAIRAIKPEVEVPWGVARLVTGTSNHKVQIWSDDMICIGTGDADFGSLQECRKAIAWYVEQLGGKVDWK